VADRDVEYSMQLLRHGARDVVVDNGDGSALRGDIDPVIQVARAERGRPGASMPRRRVIAVLSPKGGTGKTTVSTNLAVALARRLPAQVALVDLDVQFGDCAPALGLSSHYGLGQVMAELAGGPAALRAFLTDHPSTLAVLPPPDDLVAAEQIDPDRLEPLLAAAASEFPLLVIDTASGIDASSLSAIEAATDLLLVSTTDAPSIRAVRRQLDALDKIGYSSARRTLVLNRAKARGGLPVADVEAALGLEAALQIPETRLITAATNEGISVVERNGSSAAARRFEELARYFAPDDEVGSRGFRRRS
jgi:pilus assembly protein CpaE